MSIAGEALKVGETTRRWPWNMLLAEDRPTDDVPHTFGREEIAFGRKTVSVRRDSAVKCLEQKG